MLEAQVELAPDIYAARAEYDPKYVDLDNATLRRALLGNGADNEGLLALYRQMEPQLTEFAAQAQTGQRTRDVADVEALGGRATAALRAADPTASRLEDTLAAQAQAELDSGANLDPALAAQVSQGVRAAQASRGMGFGASDASVEGLFLGREAEAMRRARQGFAGTVAAQRRASTGDPFMAILGRPSTTAALSGQVMGQGGQAGRTGQVFDPFSAYGADVANTNFNAQAAANIATANNKNAITAAGIGAAGSAASAL